MNICIHFDPESKKPITCNIHNEDCSEPSAAIPEWVEKKRAIIETKVELMLKDVLNPTAKRWKLFIADEDETFEGNMKCDYPCNSIVYLHNNTIQVLYQVEDFGKCIYEIDLDRANEHDWLMHMAHKSWADEPLIRAIASSARRILKMQGKYNFSAQETFDESAEDDAVGYVNSRNRRYKK